MAYRKDIKDWEQIFESFASLASFAVKYLLADWKRLLTAVGNSFLTTF